MAKKKAIEEVVEEVKTVEAKAKEVEVVEEVKTVEAARDTTRLLAQGTILTMHGVDIKLLEDVVVSYAGVENEAKFAALCHLTGNYEVNKKNLTAQYDFNGQIMS